MPNPREYEFYHHISLAYANWDALNLTDAYNYLKRSSELLEQLSAGEKPTELDTIKEQTSNLKHLNELMPEKPKLSTLELLKNKEAVRTLIFSIYHGAERRAKQGRWDTASLLLYRLLEIFEQSRLASYGIDTANPEYNFDDISNKEILHKINETRNKLNLVQKNELPTPVSLIDGYMVLEAINDPFNLTEAKDGSGKGIHWRRFYNEIQKRNHSILAHGFVFVSSEQYEDFKSMVDALFKLYCEIENIDFEISYNKNKFINVSLRSV